MIRRIFLPLIATAVSLLLTVCILHAEDPVTITVVKGLALIMRDGTDTWIPCSAGMTVGNGDRIKTGPDASVEIALGDPLNVAKIAPETDVFVKQGETPRRIELLNGSVMAMLKALPKDSTFEVRTPAGISGARGTGWEGRTDGTIATFAAFERTIYVQGVDRSGNPLAGETTVGEGFKTVVEAFARPGPLEKLTGDDLGRWQAWQDEIAARAAAAVPEAAGLDRGLSGAERLDAVMEAKQDLLDASRLEAVRPIPEMAPPLPGGRDDDGSTDD